jgi:hypothetical protein
MLNFKIDSQACVSIENGYLPPVTFVVVQKRHHTRLFPVKKEESDRSGNIMPGFFNLFVVCTILLSIIMPFFLFLLIVFFKILSKELWSTPAFATPENLIFI